MTLKIIAKCSDMFSAELIDSVGKVKGELYSDYVPSWFPNNGVKHYGDYIELSINVDSGKILNWQRPSGALLKETFKF